VGKGLEIRYIVFNEKIQPGANQRRKLAVPSGSGVLVNRASIREYIYKGTVKPCYSIIPDALEGQHQLVLRCVRGIPEPREGEVRAQGCRPWRPPVKFTLWYNTNHYADTDMATELQRELNASGLFNVSLQSAEWTTYTQAADTDQYGSSCSAGSPTTPTRTTTRAPSTSATRSSCTITYCSSKVDSLILQEEASAVPSVRDKAVRADPDADPRRTRRSSRSGKAARSPQPATT